MGNEDIYIRTVTCFDAKELLNIYAPYVEKTAISFEYELPGIEEFASRIENTLKKYPYIAAIQNECIIAYAYASPFKQRKAYERSAETTIYVMEGKTNSGVGRLLYTTLENICKAQNIINLNACIAYPESEDPHLTTNSIGFHEHMGYKKVGTFHKCGYKFNTWYDMVWAEKMLCEHKSFPLPIIYFPDLEKNVLKAAGLKLT